MWYVFSRLFTPCLQLLMQQLHLFYIVERFTYLSELLCLATQFSTAVYASHTFHGNMSSNVTWRQAADWHSKLQRALQTMHMLYQLQVFLGYRCISARAPEAYLSSELPLSGGIECDADRLQQMTCNACRIGDTQTMIGWVAVPAAAQIHLWQASSRGCRHNISPSQCMWQYSSNVCNCRTDAKRQYKASKRKCLQVQLRGW